MSEKYKVRDKDAIYFVTITIIDWVDLISRPVYKHILVDSLQYCQTNKGLIIYAYIIMSSHLHLIVKSKEGYKLEDTVRDFKKYTSKELINTIKVYSESRRECLPAEASAQAGLLNKFSYAAGRIKRGVNYKIWQDGFHPVELTSIEMLEQRINYIHNNLAKRSHEAIASNPVEEEIVVEAEFYKYSSAIDYADGIGVLKIDKL